MKLLYLFTDRYPFDGPCTNIFRHLFFEGQLSNKNEIHVMTNKYAFNEPDFEIIEGIFIHRILCWTLLPSSEVRKALRSHFFIGCIGVLKKLTTKFKKKFSSFPVIQMEISHAFARHMLSINAQDFDAIIPTAGTFEIFEAVDNFVKNNPGPKVVVYQVDPGGSITGKTGKIRERSLEFEKKIYSDADAVVTKPIICRLLENKLPTEVLKKLVPCEFPNITNEFHAAYKSVRNDDKTICLYSGSFYEGVRDPSYTFRLFNRLFKLDNQIEFHIIGMKTEDIPALYNSSNIKCFGRLPLDEAKAAISAADVLVNIGNNRLSQVPSKLNDYISACKPIVNICKFRNCPTLPYLEKYHAALNLFEEDDLFDNQVELLYQFFMKSKEVAISFSEIETMYHECTPEYVAEIFRQVFLKVVGREGADELERNSVNYHK